MKREVYFHFLFWIIYMAIFTIVEGGYGNQFKEAFYLELGFLPFRLAVVYLNYFWFLPLFLRNRRIREYLIVSIVSIVIASLLARTFFYFYLNEVIFPGWNQGSFFQAYRFLQSAMIITSPMIFLIGLVIMNRWVSTERKAEQLASEKLKAELSYLRSQINPHFFFNTLNTLYGLALKKSNRTAEVVMKLSELMSYVLYDADKEFVTLEKEVEQIERYVSLEQIRYDDRFETELEIIGEMDRFQIPPLILLPFVENSFKHGVNKSSSDGWISIFIHVMDEKMNFVIKNKVSEPKNESTGDKNGVGILNVKRRLKLLFPETHHISCYEEKGFYVVELTLTKHAS